LRCNNTNREYNEISCYNKRSEIWNLVEKLTVAHLALKIFALCWRWAGHVARMGVERGCIGSWWGDRREGDNWRDLGVDGWIILGWIEKNEMGWACGAYG